LYCQAKFSTNIVFFAEIKNMLDYWERVTKIIADQNTKQSWLAEKAGILQQTLSQWIIKGRLPNVKEGQKIAETLETTVEYLVTGQPPAGLSIEAMEIAQKFSNLSPSGQKAAQSMMEGLLQDYPRQPMQAEAPAG
jgi:transcriptional regulator with XRE-family HTH domain